jgi:integrase
MTEIQKRSYGSGGLRARTDAKGSEVWFGTWYADGRRVQRRLGLKRAAGASTGLTRTQAEAELRRQIATAVPIHRADGDRRTLDLAGTAYVQALREMGRKRTTITAVESAFKIWLSPHLGDRALDAITPQDVDDLIAVMRKKGISSKSIRNYLGTLSACYRWSMHPRRRWSRVNPVDAVDLPARDKHQSISFLTGAEIETLLDNVVTGEWASLDRVLYLTAAQTGFRQGELIALRWSDIDFEARRVRVTRGHVLGEFDTPKSTASRRSVPLSNRLVDELGAWAKITKRRGPTQLVFGEPATGEPLDRNRLMRRWRKALKASGLPQHAFHHLRHSYGTAVAGAGVPIRTLQAWMGHRDVRTTMIYADYAPSEHEAEMIDKAFA